MVNIKLGNKVFNNIEEITLNTVEGEEVVFVLKTGGGEDEPDTPVELISFTIEGIDLTAKKGMTWGEWINSDYNNYADLEENGKTLVVNDYGEIQQYKENSQYSPWGLSVCLGYIPVHAEDVIEDGTPYVLGV